MAGRIGRIVRPPSSPDLIPLEDFNLLGYVKVQAYSQRVNTLDELKVRIIVEIAKVTKDMLQRVRQEMGCG
jgi:hypothetical protein